MSASFTPLITATLCFVLGHFVLSTLAIRNFLTAKLSRNGFLGLYILFAIAAFIWMNVAYARAPFEDLWGDPLWARWLGVFVMPVSAFLLAAGAMTANPTMFFFDGLLEQGRAPTGIQKITRHPILWAIAIWAGVHVLANGDQASLIFFGGMLGLSLFGMVHIEARKRAEGGELWTRFTEASSFFPLGGIITGRIRVTMGEIGWNRIAAGVILYFLFLFGHRLAIDVPLLPQLSGT